jgi:hypothetical protein
MSTHVPHRHNEGGFDRASSQVIGALLLIALGGVFLAQQAGILSHEANWWVIFLLIPGLGCFWRAYSTYQETQDLGTTAVTQIILGFVLVLLTIIFIFDPTWTFLSGIGFDRILPGVNWDQVWRYGLIVVGLVLLAAGIVLRRVGTAIFGAVTALVGGVFVFNINWDYVWPLALILPGIWLLFSASRRRVE